MTYLQTSSVYYCTLVKEDELYDEAPVSSYKADGKLHAQERDVAKYWRKGLVRIALYGLENQTDIDNDMPLRLFSYDGAAYRAQLLTDKQMMEGGQTTMCEVLDRIENKDLQKGQDIILSLNHYLLANDRIEDLKKATENKAYREKLLSKMSL